MNTPQVLTLIAHPVIHSRNGAPDRTRTCGTRFRKPLLYPLSYRGVKSDSIVMILRVAPEPVTSERVA